MQKQQNIIDIISNLEQNKSDCSLECVVEELEKNNLKVSKNYVSKVYYNKKNINKKISFYELQNKDRIKKILKIAECNNEENKIILSEIRQLVKKAKISVGNSKLKEILINGGYELKINYDDFAKRRIEMAELTRLGWTMQMIGKKYGITRQAVSLLLKKASSQDNQVVVKGRQKNNEGPNCVLVKRRKSLDKARICEGCGKKYNAENKKNKTCSKECFQKITRGGKWSRHEFINLTCNNCGKEFQRSNYIYSISMKRNKTNNHYCGRDCYLEMSAKHIVWRK